MRKPRWDSGWNRPVAALELAVQPIVLVIAFVAEGVPGVVDQVKYWRYLAKTIRTGKQGPSRGIVW